MQSLTSCSATPLRGRKDPRLEEQNIQGRGPRSRDIWPRLLGLLRWRQKHYRAEGQARAHAGISARGAGWWRVRAGADALVSASNGLYIPASNGLYIPASNGLHARLKRGAGPNSVKSDRGTGMTVKWSLDTEQMY